ncbi:hypothetical protein [Sorangium sp. So ce233]|uniref:hypothetical protein n=1 Tax=Sorangium sp. So ce233 TaxID=3133290 RepID=UPI003F5E8908
MKASQEILDFYTRPAAMTSAGAHAPLLDELPRDVPSLVRVVQGLLLHQHWAQAYGVERVAAVTRSPDARFDELRAAYEGDERLRVPATVFNAVLNRQDTI